MADDSNDKVIVEGVDKPAFVIDLEFKEVDVTVEQWGMTLMDGVLYVRA